MDVWAKDLIRRKRDNPNGDNPSDDLVHGIRFERRRFQAELDRLRSKWQRKMDKLLGKTVEGKVLKLAGRR